MQLRTARVCLDCEEVHDAQQCPTCASETFAFLTRWVLSLSVRQRAASSRSGQSGSGRDLPRDAVAAAADRLEPDSSRCVGAGDFGVAGWMWQRNTRPETKSKGSGPATGDNRGTGS
jgi:hypothetical protein